MSHLLLHHLLPHRLVIFKRSVHIIAVVLTVRGELYKFFTGAHPQPLARPSPEIMADTSIYCPSTRRSEAAGELPRSRFDLR